MKEKPRCTLTVLPIRDDIAYPYYCTYIHSDALAGVLPVRDTCGYTAALYLDLRAVLRRVFTKRPMSLMKL